MCIRVPCASGFPMHRGFLCILHVESRLLSSQTVLPLGFKKNIHDKELRQKKKRSDLRHLKIYSSRNVSFEEINYLTLLLKLCKFTPLIARKHILHIRKRTFLIRQDMFRSFSDHLQLWLD